MLDWMQRLAVERVPGRVSGAWRFNGARALVEARNQRRKLFPHLLLVTGLLLGPTGCRTAHHESVGGDHSAHGNAPRLELNDGKKWVMPPPMMVYIGNLQQAVRDFDQSPGRDHARLAARIQEELGQLVTHCTMEGKAHDALHKWLMPLLGLSTDYSKAKDPQVQQQKVQEIKKALLVFNEYFE